MLNKLRLHKSAGEHQGVLFFWLAIFSVSLILQSFNLIERVHYDRARIADGAYWLLLTGHLVHLNWSHFAMNMAGLAIVAFFFSPHANFKQWLLVAIVSATVISAGLWWWLTDIIYYVGLSGVLHGFFLFGALREIRVYRLSGLALVSVLTIKLSWEFFNGALPSSQDMTGGHVLTEAHLLGAIGGVLVWLYLVWHNRSEIKVAL